MTLRSKNSLRRASAAAYDSASSPSRRVLTPWMKTSGISAPSSLAHDSDSTGGAPFFFQVPATGRSSDGPAQPVGLVAGQLLKDRKEVAHAPTLPGLAATNPAPADLLQRSPVRHLDQRHEPPARQPGVPPDVVGPGPGSRRVVVAEIGAVPFDQGDQIRMFWV